jgi:uncharacterized membrane protein YqhA
MFFYIHKKSALVGFHFCSVIVIVIVFKFSNFISTINSCMKGIIDSFDASKMKEKLKTKPNPISNISLVNFISRNCRALSGVAGCVCFFDSLVTAASW